MPRVALVDPVETVADIREGGNPYWAALLDELRQLRWVEHRTVIFDRWSQRGNATARDYDALARKVTGSGPRVVVAFGRKMIVSMSEATKEIPIVAIGTLLPNLYASLAHPGKNVTGIQVGSDQQKLYGKQLQFLRDVTRAGARIAWFGSELDWRGPVGEAFRVGARQTSLMLHPVFVKGPDSEIAVRQSFAPIATSKFDAVLVSPTPELFRYRAIVAEMAMAARLPSIGFNGYYAQAGLLMSYGADFSDLFRRAAHLVDNILRGAKPGDLPIEQPTKIHLAINLKTAKALGLKIPQELLLRADEVIE